MPCYRVWCDEPEAVVINAPNEQEAIAQASAYLGCSQSQISRVENLTEQVYAKKVIELQSKLEQYKQLGITANMNLRQRQWRELVETINSADQAPRERLAAVVRAGWEDHFLLVPTASERERTALVWLVATMRREWDHQAQQIGQLKLQLKKAGLEPWG